MNPSEWLEFVAMFIILYLFVAFLWQAAEYHIYGRVYPSKVDEVVAIILAVSLYFNIK